MPGHEEQPAVIYSQGLRLFGNFCLPEKGAAGVIGSHGLESSKDGDKWLVLSPRLCDSGFAFLRFSYRGCGEGQDKSEGNFEDTTLTGRVQDYRAAIDFMRKTGINGRRLGTIGSSLGGMAVLAAGDEGVRAMVTLATPCEIVRPDDKEYFELGLGRRLRTRFFEDLRRYDMGEAVGKIHCPLLIIHGSQDEAVPVEDARRLYRHANEPKRLEIIDGANHVFDAPEHLEQVITLSLQWFQMYL